MIKEAPHIDVKDLLRHPKVWGMVSGDSQEDFEITGRCFGYYRGDKLIAVLGCRPLSQILFDVHIAAHPDTWGCTKPILYSLGQYVFKNSTCIKMVGFIPAYNKPAIAIAKRCGFKHEGTLTKSVVKGWKLHDQEIFGMSKGDA